MDFTPIYNLLTNFWYLIPIIILISILKSPWFKGIMGEAIINLQAKLFLNKDEYHLIKNVTLPTENGTTQIDHIIVSKYGIFVIETKNMKGWILGSPNQKTWTQKIFKHTNKFQNPLHQNYKHVKTLESLLGLNDAQIHSVVVFIGDSKFKTEMPDNVTYGRGYIRHIKSKKNIVLSTEAVNEIISKIQSGRLTQSFKTNRQHVKHVQEIIKEKSDNVLCPKCQSPMIMRNAKSGMNKGNQFWGCSQFPACRGVVSIT